MKNQEMKLGNGFYLYCVWMEMSIKVNSTPFSDNFFVKDFSVSETFVTIKYRKNIFTKQCLRAFNPFCSENNGNDWLLKKKQTKLEENQQTL